MTTKYDENRFKNNKILTNYVESRIGKLKFQINAFKAYWLIMDVFHEVKCNRKILESKKHIKKQLKNNKLLENIELKKLPFFPKCYLFLLKLHLYFIALIAAKFISKIRDRVK